MFRAGFLFSSVASNGSYHAILPLSPGFSYSSSSVTLNSVVAVVGKSTVPSPDIFTTRFWYNCIDIYTQDSSMAGQCVMFSLTVS